MKLAIISPTGLLTKYSEPNYHLALAHLAKEDDLYLQYYQKMSRSDSTYVILDNSMVELGEPMPVGKLDDVIYAMRPNEFVLPDYRKEPAKTLLAAKQLSKGYKRKYPDMKLMVVPQWGYNEYLWEWFDSMQQLWEHADTIGVPKFLREKRIEALRLIEANNLQEKKEFHLLGTWGNPIEVKTVQKEFPWVRGVDSKIPVRLGQRGVALHPVLGLVLERDSVGGMELTHSSDPFPFITEWNIDLMRAWCNGEDVNTFAEGPIRALRTVSLEG